MDSKKEREIPLTLRAKRLGLYRSSLYYEPIGPSEDEIRIKHRIEKHYQYPFFGSRRMTAMLRRENRIMNRKTVQRYMRGMGIEGITPGPNVSRRNRQHMIYPYLLRGLTIDRPNQGWGNDPIFG